MYNDYYLEQINSKLGTTNNLIDDIKDNQTMIIQNQQILISGDIQIEQNQKRIETGIGLVAIIVMMILIYNFIVRSLK